MSASSAERTRKTKNKEKTTKINRKAAAIKLEISQKSSVETAEIINKTMKKQ